MSVLWIDDDVRNLITLREDIEREGYAVTTFDGVDEAWKFLSDAPVDQKFCIILDIMMATGERLKGIDTGGGVKTGEQFLRQVHLKHPDWLDRHKFMIYTITDHLSTKRLAKDLNVLYYSKLDYAGRDFVGALKEAMMPPTDGK